MHKIRLYVAAFIIAFAAGAVAASVSFAGVSFSEYPLGFALVMFLIVLASGGLCAMIATSAEARRHDQSYRAGLREGARRAGERAPPPPQSLQVVPQDLLDLHARIAADVAEAIALLQSASELSRMAVDGVVHVDRYVATVSAQNVSLREEVTKLDQIGRILRGVPGAVPGTGLWPVEKPAAAPAAPEEPADEADAGPAVTVEEPAAHEAVQEPPPSAAPQAPAQAGPEAYAPPAARPAPREEPTGRIRVPEFLLRSASPRALPVDLDSLERALGAVAQPVGARTISAVFKPALLASDA